MSDSRRRSRRALAINHGTLVGIAQYAFKYQRFAITSHDPPLRVFECDRKTNLSTMFGTFLNRSRCDRKVN